MGEQGARRQQRERSRGVGLPWGSLGGMRPCLLPGHRRILCKAARSPFIQPRVPVPILPALLCASAALLPDPAPGHRSAHQAGQRSWPALRRAPAAGRAEGQVHVGSRPAFSAWGCCCQHIQCLRFLPVLIPPSLPCPSSPGSGELAPPPSSIREIATIHHDQQGPSKPTGGAINFRDMVASGREIVDVPGSAGGCLLTPLLCTSAPAPPHPELHRADQPGARQARILQVHLLLFPARSQLTCT